MSKNIIYTVPILKQTWIVDSKRAKTFIIARYAATLTILVGGIASLFANGLFQVILPAILVLVSLTMLKTIDRSNALRCILVQIQTDIQPRTTFAPLLLIAAHIALIGLYLVFAWQFYG